MFAFLFKRVQLFIISLLFIFLPSSYASWQMVNIIYASALPDITQNKTGNYAQLSTLLKQQRENFPSTIFLFGGNSLGPSPMSSLDKGVHIIDLLNSLEPDVMAVNKREFSFFEDELSLRSYEAAFPFVLSNVYDNLTNDNIDGLYSTIILKRDQLKIGILSVIEPDVIEEYATKRIKVKDIKKSIVLHANQLKKQRADIIILLASDIFEPTDELLKNGIIDLAFSKNEYFKLSKKSIKPKHKRNILLSNKNDISQVQLVFDKKNRKIKEFTTSFTALNEYKNDPIVLKQLTTYTTRLDQLLDEKIGLLKTSMNSKRKKVREAESAFGNLLADTIKDYTNAQISLINGGTIRGETTYKKNHELTRRDIAKELPYRNEIVLIDIKGYELLDALENGFSTIEQLLGRFPHVSGMQVIYNSQEEKGKRVKKVLIQGKTLNKIQSYKLATTSYLASGGDGYSMFLGKKFLKYPNPSHRLIADVLVEYIIKKREISPIVEGRVKDIK